MQRGEIISKYYGKQPCPHPDFSIYQFCNKKLKPELEGADE
jgi:hypothetical protein